MNAIFSFAINGSGSIENLEWENAIGLFGTEKSFDGNFFHHRLWSPFWKTFLLMRGKILYGSVVLNVLCCQFYFK